ncbi:DNA polymerase III subunit delta [Rhodohalobacter mucosus]|uniref:DNA polymerase III subunit delta n=1 Tax=Rhodohalobacter mucosus TaxID=2079485 RepID=A0A316TSH8_9BACT|nr:DNA polymerase III subunit delta [Rhodohalobacter mucosus]PWN07583.1 DNA polymerase III subunit delta [Rhodohalobacter mucosus]
MAKPTSIDTFKQLFRELRQREGLKPVYYLHGEETFFIDLLQEEFEKLIPDEQKDFNFDLLYGSDVSPAQVLGIARSFPMMAEKRVIIVRDFLKLGENTDDGNLNDFAPYAEQPNPSTILCLIDSKYPDKRTALGKALKESGSTGVYEFDVLPVYKLPEWVIDWTRHTHSKEMEPDAARILSEMAGQDLTLLSTEIDKVCTFVDTSDRITTDDIKKTSGSYRDYSVIELKNAVLNRNLDQALGIAEQMLLKNNYSAGEVIKTVGFFYNVFGNIWQIRRLTEKGLTKNEVQSQLGMKSNYFFNAQWSEASRFSLAEMPGIFEALLDADSAAKGYSTLDTSSIFLLLIKRIIG